MRKIIVFLLFLQVQHFSIGQEKFALNLGVNSWYPFGGLPTIKNYFFNVRSDVQYALNNKSGVSIGYNFTYLKKRNPDNPYSIKLSDLNLNYYYLIGEKRKHYFHHGLGTYIHHNLKDTEVYYLIDDPIHQSLSMYYEPNLQLDPQEYALLKKMPFFIESGYRFYVLDNLYLGLSGRVSLIRYETPIPDDNSDVIISKLGFSYSIYYGLGYTFGRD